jgi:hypothetical protein
MKRFIEGVDRSQATLVPEYLEDWIEEENPVRAVDLGGLRRTGRVARVIIRHRC